MEINDNNKLSPDITSFRIQKQIEKTKFDDAIDLYNKSKEIFIEIQWDDQVEIIMKGLIFQ